MVSTTLQLHGRPDPGCEVLPFCSAKHSGVNSPDAEQQPPERDAICNPTPYENASKQGLMMAKSWFGLTFQSVLRR